MHYKNGTPAQTGDAVIIKDYNGRIQAGVIHSLNAKATTCNGTVAVPVPGGVIQFCDTVGNMYSAADAFAALEAKQPPTP